MIHLCVADIQTCLHASPAFSGYDGLITGISIDSRNIRSGDLFVAIRGEHFDGHDFIAAAQKKGAVAVVVEGDKDVCEQHELPTFYVSNTQRALGQLAKCVRQKFSGKVIGITGSNGKTTVKGLVAHLLRTKYRVLSTAGNFNNEIGVPLTLFGLMRETYDVAVVEMGASQRGDIAYLTDISQPDIATITHIGCAHMEGLGGIEGVLEEKTQIFNGIDNTGYAVVNAGSAHYPYWNNRLQGQTLVTYGCAEADIQLSSEIVFERRKNRPLLRFSLAIKPQSLWCDKEYVLPLSTELCGQHNVSNIQAAIATVWPFLLNVADVQAAVANFSSMKGRFTIKENAHGVVVIDDTYNANLDSLKAAVDALQAFDGKKILVMGDMQELGAQSMEQHAMAGEYAKTHGIETFIACGEWVKYAGAYFDAPSQCFATIHPLIHYLKTELNFEQATVVLVKGSRSAKMERVVDALLTQEAMACC